MLTLYPSFLSPPATRIFLELPMYLFFHTNSQISLCSSKQNPVFVFNRIVHIYKLKRINICMLSSTQEHTVFPFVQVFFLPLCNTPKFSSCRSCTFLIRFILGILYFVILNGVFHLCFCLVIAYKY